MTAGKNYLGLNNTGDTVTLKDAKGKVVYAAVNAEPGQQVDFDAIRKAVESC